MNIPRDSRAEQTELKLEGRMDATWSDHVAHALSDCVRDGHHNVVVDMAKVDYISSAGIRILVLYARRLSAIRGRLRVINASSIVQRVLELAGLDGLLLASIGPVAPAATTAEGRTGTLALSELGATAEVFALDPDATLRVHWPGNAQAWFAGAPCETIATVEFPANVIGVGLGALVSGNSPNAESVGEFLAAAGVAVCQPADGFNKPDYLLLQGALIPTIEVGYGMLGRGGFRNLVRFDKGPQQASLPLSAVVKACLQTSGSDAVGLAMVAETASLIGAARTKSPAPPPAAGQAQDPFAFPEVRDWLSFTAEPAFPSSTCLVAGFAATQSRGPSLRLLKPMVRSGELWGHFHAVALPYRPLHKGRMDLAETLRLLFESEQVLGVLHLLNDWRELNGAGESRFLRGACWCSPLTL